MWNRLNFGLNNQIMMKKTGIVCCLFFLTLIKLLGQTNESGLVDHMPQESIYMHLNTTFLFNGEQLQYKVYCLDNATKKLSDLSKVAHVYFVDSDNKLVFSQKLPLTNGTGQGDFFVPLSLPTGSYKLFCLTQWMRNGPPEEFFRVELQIINPYRPIPEPYISRDTSSVDTINSKNGQSLAQRNQVAQQDNGIKLNLSLEKDKVGKRQRIGVVFSNFEDAEVHGNYSLSVRFCAPIEGLQNSLESFYRDFLNRPQYYPSSKTIVQIPELRGTLLSGRLVVKEGNTPVSGHRVALSLPGKNSFFQISSANNNGRFYFNVDRSFGNIAGYFQLLDSDWQNLGVEMDSETPNFGKTTFQDFKIPEKLSGFILERSIQNQIESSYAEAKQDTVLVGQAPVSIHKDLPYSYELDDYTRFGSIEETMVEVIDHVWLNKEAGKRFFQVRPEEGVPDSDFLPLVMVDGLFIKDHESFMDFSAKRIKSIHFSREKFFIGSMYFQGILKFETIEGDFVDDYNTSEIHQVALSGPEPSKSYYVQEYNSTASNAYLRIPDFRNQLLWNPSLNLQKEQTIAFYTSDVPGTYEIVLKGFTSEGKPVEIKKYFDVF